MSNLFISIHNDDESLYGSYLIQRLKPLVVVVTDGQQHLEKFGVPIQQRRDETIEAMKILEPAEVRFSGIPDTCFDKDVFIKALKDLNFTGGIVFAPATEGGNPHHDIISQVAEECFGETSLVLYYGTYGPNRVTPIGELKIIGTEEEREKKHQSLQCYTSQLKINPRFFEENDFGPEYISFNRIQNA